MTISEQIAAELGVREAQISATVTLIDEGSTIPFIARYRKEVTGGLDDTQLRQLDERLGYLRELQDRRLVVINAIEEQGKLTPVLKQQILTADTKTRLEDLYRPYMKKRRTKAQIAKEQGLEPLALELLENPELDPEKQAAIYVTQIDAIADTKAALEGAKQILMERFAEDADLVGKLRERLWSEGVLTSQLVSGMEQSGSKFSDYFEFSERLEKIPSHRALALFRGRKEGVLNLTLDLTLSEGATIHPAESMIAAHNAIRNNGRPADSWLLGVVRWAWKVKIHTHLDTELKGRLREQSDEEAIKVFASNLGDLLLAAPAGQRATLGLDPGLRTGVKVAVVDATGKMVDFATIYPHAPKNRWDDSIATVAALCKKHQVDLISIGNGTASRETERLASDLEKRHPELKLTHVVVSEAGASVYSASEFASKEFPDLDVSIRGAVSIARRLQDPLAELVKIEPKAIGVGQYQHDLSQTRLSHTLDGVVERCVNDVGVDVNTASAPLLTQVAGLTSTLSNNIVAFRDEYGPFKSRKALLKVPRYGAKAFEQSAGFLRIRNGVQPLDASAVHPEAYKIVEQMATKSGRSIESIIGDGSFLGKIKITDFVNERFGEPTLRDILKELEKPGRDPRPEFKSAKFKEGVETMNDLDPGMILEGVVSNVTNFGAFVDIGVHQDGLVHISALANTFVKDPRDVVKTGDVVQVKVMEIDTARKRIALSMRLDEKIEAKEKSASRQPSRQQKSYSSGDSKGAGNQSPAGGALADALKRAKLA